MIKIKTESFDQRVNRISEQVKADGYVHSLDARYTVSTDQDCPWIVRAFEGDKLVAYSEMKGDFEQSLAEFVEDYLA